MNKFEKKREHDESTLLSTMARVPSKSNFSINTILPELVDRDTPAEASPAPSAESDADNASTDGDVNVDYESDMEGKHHYCLRTNINFVQFCDDGVNVNIEVIEKNVNTLFLMKC